MMIIDLSLYLYDDEDQCIYQCTIYILIGDGYALENKFDFAQHMYEAQIMWIRSRPSIDIKALAICHGRMGKMFLKLDKFNRAIVEFDRQLSLGNEIDDKPGE